MPKGVFNRARKRPGPGLGEAPTSVSECPKGYSETLLAYVIGTALPTCSLKPSLPLPGSKIGVYYCLHWEETE